MVESWGPSSVTGTAVYNQVRRVDLLQNVRCEGDEGIHVNLHGREKFP
jgi:hypothetical protein